MVRANSEGEPRRHFKRGMDTGAREEVPTPVITPTAAFSDLTWWELAVLAVAVVVLVVLR